MKISILNKISFRYKIGLIQIFIFFLFLFLVFLTSEWVVRVITRKALEETSSVLVENVQKQKNIEDVINYLSQEKKAAFFQIALLDAHFNVLFVAEKKGASEKIVSSKELAEMKRALQGDSHYFIEDSKELGGKFSFVILRISFQGKTYLLRTAFPFKETALLEQSIRLGVISFSGLLFLLFALSSWLLFHRLTKPIQEIIEQIGPKKGVVREFFRKIELSQGADLEFIRLADVFNELVAKVQEEIFRVLKEKNEKESILGALVEGVVAVDEHLTIHYLNQTAATLLGEEATHLLGMPFSKGRENLLMKTAYNLIQESIQKDTVQYDSLILDKRDKRHIDLIAIPTPFGSGSVLVLQDQTSKHQLLEIGKEFIANASHELKTPITIMRGFAEVLQDLVKEKEIDRESARSVAEKIVRSCLRMEILVKNLLLLSDVERGGEAKTKRVDLVVLLQDCRAIMLEKHPSAEISFHSSKSQITAYVEPTLLELAITNLIDNGVKYSSVPAKIEISLQERGRKVEIRIKDQGQGIPSEDLPHIFQRFYTVDKSHSRKLGGAGLGLSIVKTIVEKHSGEISITSQLGVGSEIAIILPKTS